MRFEIAFERVYPHPVDKVWRALTDPAALGEWLMETDFVPEAGRAFTMWCQDGRGGTDTYRCKVLVYDPPRRMLWSWVLDDRQGDGETLVDIRVAAVRAGTRVTITHSGDRDRDTIESFKSGWPDKLEQLARSLSAAPTENPGGE